jgi:hypothetical protein
MKRSLELILASVLLASPVLANPIATEALKVRAVPGPHVQLTYAVEGRTPQPPLNVVTFGTKSTPWKALDGSFNTNTGSGIRALNAVQMCDCNVAIGQTLAYQFTLDSSRGPYTVSISFGKYDASVTPPPSVDSGVKPWEIPDPIEIQGLDCAVECSSVVPQGLDAAQGTGGEIGLDAAGGAPGTGGTTAPATTNPSSDNKGSSCSISQGRPTGLFVLVMSLGLAFFGRRKRAS